MSKMTLEELLYCGDVGVDVGFTLSGGFVEARTNSTLMNYADLGGEISVTLYEDVLEDKDGGIYVRPEAWAELLREMRDMLARCFILGRMVVSSEGLLFGVDEENSKSIEEAEKLLGEEFFYITLDTVMRALKARRDEETKVREGWQMLANLMAEDGLRRGLNKEKREEMTIGEAFGPKEDEGED